MNYDNTRYRILHNGIYGFEYICPKCGCKNQTNAIYGFKCVGCGKMIHTSTKMFKEANKKGKFK